MVYVSWWFRLIISSIAVVQQTLEINITLNSTEYLQSWSSTYIRSHGYGTKNRSHQLVNMLETWEFYTAPGFILKIILMHISLHPPIYDSSVQICSDGLFITDELISSVDPVAVFCGSNWHTEPTLYSTRNLIRLKLNVSKFQPHNGILGVVESVSELSSDKVSFDCKRHISTLDSVYLTSSSLNFPRNHTCWMNISIAKQTGMNAFATMTISSLMFKLKIFSKHPTHCTANKLKIDYSDNEDSNHNFETDLCSTLPPRKTFEFKKSINISIYVKEPAILYSFSAYVKLEYCPFDMVLNVTYCSLCSITCTSIMKYQNVSSCSQSCLGNCQCPSSRPFLHDDRCITTEECNGTYKMQKVVSQQGYSHHDDTVLPMLHREKREASVSTCVDNFENLNFCQMHKLEGHCKWQLVADQCKRTCGLCVIESWGSWSEWSLCSQNCNGGKQQRTKSCEPNCIGVQYQVKDCATQPCEKIGNQRSISNPSMDPYSRLNGNLGSPEGRIYFEGSGNSKEFKEYKCGANAFGCDRTKCFDNTRLCNGYYECSTWEDEKDCPLGVRRDGKKVIMNWKTHKCLDVHYNKDGDLIPWGYRRCPGHSSPELERYWWLWRSKYQLMHLQSGKCLHANVSGDKVVILLKICNLADSHQRWVCEIPSLRVKLQFPFSILPRSRQGDIYLGLSKEGPGSTLELTSEISETTTDFHTRETDQLPICSGGESNIWLPQQCSKSCGNGTIRVLRRCANFGKKDCNGGSLYKIIPCNTKPCLDFCPPNWSVLYPRHNTKDLNCFKHFELPKTYTEAQKYCKASNWSLAADKNAETHKFILQLQRGIRKAWIGVYEDLELPYDGPASHTLRYDYDRQPVGGFHPWTHHGSTDYADLPGCTLGRGGSYYGISSTLSNRSSCGPWTSKADPDRFKPLPQLVPPYYAISAANNLCRNPNLDPDGLWCYPGPGKLSAPCNVSDCLDVPIDEPSKKAFPTIDEQHKFVIRSQRGKLGERRWCLTSVIPNWDDDSSILKLWICDMADVYEHFYWWSTTTLVNSASNLCLSLTKTPPTHGDKIAFKPCKRSQTIFTQSWVTVGPYIVSAWKAHELKMKRPLMKIAYDRLSRKVYLSDMRRSLFFMWSEKLGEMPLSTVLSRAPAGPYIVLRGCRGCMTHAISRGFDLLTMLPCSQRDASQRWVILGNGNLMNAESGKCLAAFEMHAYAIVRHCAKADVSFKWQWKSSVNENIVEYVNSTIKHISSNYYLRCGCLGLSELCLTPHAGDDNATWQFLPAAASMSPKARAVIEKHGNARGLLGYSFALQTAANMTRCARPIIDSEARNNTGDSIPLRVEFLPCRLHLAGFYWTLSGFVSQIKHRSLDRCIDSMLDTVDTESSIGHEAMLLPCSQSRLDQQSWIFKQSTQISDPHDPVGDYIYLASDPQYYLSVNKTILEDSQELEERLVLVVMKEDDTDKWEARNFLGNVVGVSEMADCTLPWTKMQNYRGKRSWTRDGIRCQPWKAMMPHRHPFDPKKISYLVENRCRKPPGPPTDILSRKNEDHTWCMTLDPTVTWQDCLVSRCPVPAAVALVTDTETWEVTTGEIKLPFICQTPGECYYGVGVDFSGYTNWTGRGYCMNWREYYNGDMTWPDHAHCANPTRSFIKPWCWVRKGVPQYCETVNKCVDRCLAPTHGMKNMKIASISYTTPSHMYSVGSKIQLVCKTGYNISLPNHNHVQTITCFANGEWKPEVKECRKIFCPMPTTVKNARLLTSKSRFTYGSRAIFQCNKGHMITPGRIVIEISCLKSGSWSKLPYKCVPACPNNYVSFKSSCYHISFNFTDYKNFESAQTACEQKFGKLAVPKNKLVHDFIKWLIANASGHTEFEYWLGVKDFGVSKNSPAARVWESSDRSVKQRNLYIKEMVQHHRFKIRNFGSTIEREERLAYTDRCMYGDKLTKKVYSSSCSFENETGTWWTWISFTQLYNIDAGLCLRANQYDGSNGDGGSVPGSVLLEQCDQASIEQRFTCGPHSGYLLKLRTPPASFLSIDPKSDQLEVVVGGPHVSGPLSMWHAYPQMVYLCHYNLKPPDTYFIVHHGAVPPYNSFTQFESDKCLQKRTGAKLAQESDVQSHHVTLGLSWCACLFMEGSTSVVSSSVVWDEDCGIANTGLSGPQRKKTGRCDMEDSGDSFCYRESQTQVSYSLLPNWCGAFVPHFFQNSKMEARFCSSLLAGYVCETEAKWNCSVPYIPKNSIPVLESGNFTSMQFAYGQEITIHCKRGFIFPDMTKTASLTCNQFQSWEVTKVLKEDEATTYVDDRKLREADVFDLACIPLTCRDPPKVAGMVVKVASTEEGAYPIGTVATYMCPEGTELDYNVNLHNVTCMDDQQWQTPLNPEKKCQSISCSKPPEVAHALVSSYSLVFDSPASYICDEGYWFKRGQTVLISYCNTSRNWSPTPKSCVQLTCPTVSKVNLTLANAELVSPAQTLNFFGSQITIRCLPGYWFDKERFTASFECDNRGQWLPFSPHQAKCELLYCPWPRDVPGAILWGSDRRPGNHIRYECGPKHWLRRAFKLFSPHWGLCLWVKGGKDPEFDFPKEPFVDVSSPRRLELDAQCDGYHTERNVWMWHWSFHLRNPLTDTCLTATALPAMQEDLVTVTAEACDRHNVYQHWKCVQVKDGSNSQLLALRMLKSGGYLSTNAYDYAYWSGKDKVYLVVTGDKTATGVNSFWKVFGSDETSATDICLLREGHSFEVSVCSSFGKWIPSPYLLECTLVDCGDPPQYLHATMKYPEESKELSSSHFGAPNILEHTGSNYFRKSNFSVSTIISYNCDVGKWVQEGVFAYPIICHSNGRWKSLNADLPPISNELVCVDVTCPAPRILSHATALVYPEKLPVDFYEKELESTFTGPMLYRKDIAHRYAPTYKSKVIVTCTVGYWLLYSSLRNMLPQTNMTHLNGSRVVTAICNSDGSWTQPVVSDGIRCVPVLCPKLDAVAKARQFLTKMNSTLPYGSIIQYQCLKGYWFDPTRIYVEVRCNEHGKWLPDPKNLKCILGSCRDPGPVVFAIRNGTNFRVGAQLTFTCLPGRLMNNRWKSVVATCQSDGLWFPPPSDIICTLQECPTLPTISHSTFKNYSQTYRNKFVIGDSVELHCEDGYSFDSTSSVALLSCTTNGVWFPAFVNNGEEFQCKPVHCPIPPQITDFSAVLHGSSLFYRKGDKVKYICPEGTWTMGLTGPALAFEAACEVNQSGIIQKGKPVYNLIWSPDVHNQSCVRVTCPTPGIVAYSLLSISGLEYHSTVTYTCIPGYHIQQTALEKFQLSQTSVCSHVGHWEPTASTISCVPVLCADPGNISGATRLPGLRSGPLYYYRDQVEYKCSTEKYFIALDSNGQSIFPGQLWWVVTCLHDGTWDLLPQDQFVSCQPISCPSPPFIPMAEIATNHSGGLASTYPAHTMYSITCPTGLVLSTTGHQHEDFQCQLSGVWKPFDPSSTICEKLHCSDPGPRNESTRIIEGFEYLDRITYYANEGYGSLGLNISGKPQQVVTLQCTVSGSWVVLDVITALDIESDSTYPRDRRSVENALDLEEEHITFVALTCAYPQLTKNLTIPSTTPSASGATSNKTVSSANKMFSVGDTIDLKCIPKHFLSMNATSISIQCMAFGDWYPVLQHINCLPGGEWKCDLPKTPPNASLECMPSIFLYQATVQFRLLKLTEYFAKIYDDLDQLTCTEIYIPKVEKNFQRCYVFTVTDYQLDSVATIRCLYGYELRPGIASTTIMCTSEGIWEPDPLTDVSCSLISCTDPPNIADATLNFKGTVFHDYARYQCDSGYSFSPLANDTEFMSVCLGDKSWIPDPSKMKCSLIDCGKPTNVIMPNEESRDLQSTTYSSVFNVTCKEGFHFVDDSGISHDTISVSCGIDGHWTTSAIDVIGITSFTQCVAIDCGEPPVVDNAFAALSGGFSFQAQALYRCKPGFKTDPPGPSLTKTTFTTTCAGNGKWEAPQNVQYNCVPGECPALGSKANAVITYSAPSAPTSLGSQATITCDNGYANKQFGNEIKVECMWYGEWEPDGTSVACETLKCSPAPTMPNATPSGSVTAGSTWTYTCSAGYEISTTSNAVSMQCSMQAQWIPTYTMLDKCRQQSCPPPNLYPGNTQAYTQDGIKIDPNAPPSNYYIPVGTVVEFKCVEGYWITLTQAVSQKVTCLNSQAYNPNLSSLSDCDSISCPNPSTVSGATMIGQNNVGTYFYGNSVKYQCPNGMHFRAQQLQTVESKCSATGFFVPDPQTLSCQTVECPKYDMPFATLDLLTSQDIDGEATYSCLSGAWYKPGTTSRTFTCSSDGKWTPDINVNKCKEMTCLMPTIPNSIVLTKEVKTGQKLTVACQPGFTVSGASTLNCEDSGELSPATSKCEPVSCGQPVLSRFVIMSNSSYFVGDVVTITCLPGYWMGPGIFSKKIKCRGDKTWSDDAKQIVCAPFECEQPGNTKNASVVKSSHGYLSNHTVNCHEGFWIFETKVLSQESVCQTNGTWLPSIPKACVRIFCDTPTTLNASSLKYDTLMYQSEALYVCKPLHWIAENNVTHWSISGKKQVKVRCENKGKWNPNPGVDFICSSIIDGDVLLSDVSGKASVDPGRFAQPGPPYSTLIGTLPMTWLKLNSSQATVSDSFLSTENDESSVSYRDIRSVWDYNPLTYWMAPTLTPIDQETGWTVEAYLGRPVAVFAIMIMCIDDGQSDISSFSLVFAGSNKGTKTVGPYKVYGDSGISGTPHLDFPMPFSSVATAWTFSGLQDEMLWFHLLIHGTVVPGMRPAIREISLFVSEVQRQPIYPRDPFPTVFLVSLFLFLLAVLSPLMYYLDLRFFPITVCAPPANENHKLQVIFRTHCSPLKKSHYRHLLFKLSTPESDRFPAVWLRGDDRPSILWGKNTRNLVFLPIPDTVLSEDIRIDFISWLTTEDPGKAYARIEIADKCDPGIEISDIQVLNTVAGDEWLSDFERRTHLVHRSLSQYRLYAGDVCSIPLRLRETPDVDGGNALHVLRSHLLWSLVVMPKNSRLSRLERLLCIIACSVLCVTASLFLLVLLESFGAVADAVSGSQPVSVASYHIPSYILVLGGELAFFNVALAGAFVCSPLSLILRFLYELIERTTALPRLDSWMYRFCSHMVFSYRSTLRLPFMKALRASLATLLRVKLKDIDAVDVATMTLDEFAQVGLFCSVSDLSGRWSEPAALHKRSSEVDLRLWRERMRNFMLDSDMSAGERTRSTAEISRLSPRLRINSWSSDSYLARDGVSRRAGGDGKGASLKQDPNRSRDDRSWYRHDHVQDARGNNVTEDNANATDDRSMRGTIVMRDAYPLQNEKMSKFLYSDDRGEISDSVDGGDDWQNRQGHTHLYQGNASPLVGASPTGPSEMRMRDERSAAVDDDWQNSDRQRHTRFSPDKSPSMGASKSGTSEHSAYRDDERQNTPRHTHLYPDDSASTRFAFSYDRTSEERTNVETTNHRFPDDTSATTGGSMQDANDKLASPFVSNESTMDESGPGTVQSSSLESAPPRVASKKLQKIFLPRKTEANGKASPVFQDSLTAIDIGRSSDQSSVPFSVRNDVIPLGVPFANRSPSSTTDSIPTASYHHRNERPTGDMMYYLDDDSSIPILVNVFSKDRFGYSTSETTYPGSLSEQASSHRQDSFTGQFAPINSASPRHLVLSDLKCLSAVTKADVSKEGDCRSSDCFDHSPEMELTKLPKKPIGGFSYSCGYIPSRPVKQKRLVGDDCVRQDQTDDKLHTESVPAGNDLSINSNPLHSVGDVSLRRHSAPQDVAITYRQPMPSMRHSENDLRPCASEGHVASAVGSVREAISATVSAFKLAMPWRPTSRMTRAPYPSAGGAASRTASHTLTDDDLSAMSQGRAFHRSSRFSRASQEQDSRSFYRSDKSGASTRERSAVTQSSQDSTFKEVEVDRRPDRLHHEVLTHGASPKGMCVKLLSPRSVLNWLIVGVIVACCVSLIWLSQYVTTNVTADVYKAVVLALALTYMISMVIDAAVAVAIFNEDGNESRSD